MKHRNKLTRISRLILVTLSVVASCSGLAFLMIKTIANGVSLTSDAWLSFWGSIIGSVVTMLGIILTLSYENNQNKTIRRLEAQPIITFKPLALDTEPTENEGSYHLRVLGGNPADMLSLTFPDIEIHNIGLNFATKINFQFTLDCQTEHGYSCGYRDISILDVKETKRVSLSLDISKELIYQLFKNTYVYEKNKFPHACYPRTVSHLVQANRRSSVDRLEKISYVNGNIITTYEDIYGNTYQQQRTATLHYVELSDEPSFVYISFPEFSEAKLIN